jgi:hypothetical protein
MCATVNILVAGSFCHITTEQVGLGRIETTQLLHKESLTANALHTGNWLSSPANGKRDIHMSYLARYANYSWPRI